MPKIEVIGPDGRVYAIPAIQKEDWDSWIDLTGNKWVRPNYAVPVSSVK